MSCKTASGEARLLGLVEGAGVEAVVVVVVEVVRGMVVVVAVVVVVVLGAMAGVVVVDADGGLPRTFGVADAGLARSTLAGVFNPPWA